MKPYLLLLGMTLFLVTCGDDGNGDDGSGGSATSSGTTSSSGLGGAGGLGTGAAGGQTGGGGSTSNVDPPLGESSHGTGGPAPVAGTLQQAGGVSYRLLVPSSPTQPTPLLIVFSGTEGGQNMVSNLQQVASYTQTDGLIRAVLDGVDYYENGAAGATVLDDLRAKYDIDNDRTYLLGESAGTHAALELGFELRQSYFAAFWANDVNATAVPLSSAAQLGFAPWGQAGPGGAFALAQSIVDGMAAAGYQLPNPAPYAGAGAGTHGSTEQFLAAMEFFPGKVRSAL
ncbi:MAG: hypothetical protein JRI68_24545 [Deltaproteobacteria bacterium]|nr:hypothetical protein [Deltaproteobacteria bacterium]